MYFHLATGGLCKFLHAMGQSRRSKLQCVHQLTTYPYFIISECVADQTRHYSDAFFVALILASGTGRVVFPFPVPKWLTTIIQWDILVCASLCVRVCVRACVCVDG